MKTREPIVFDPLFSQKFFEFDANAANELTSEPDYPIPSSPETLSEFFSSTNADGNIYKEILKKAYQDLAKWATAHNLDPKIIDDWNDAFETKYCNYNPDEHIKLNQINFPFFTAGIWNLVKLNRLLNSDFKFPPGFCEVLITSMMNDILFCGPAGCKSILDTYYAVLGKINRSVDWLVYRREKAQEIAGQILSEYTFEEDGMPVHYGIEVLNEFADELHINKNEDGEYARELHSWIINPAKDKFPEKMSGKINVEDFIKLQVSDFEFSVKTFLNKVNLNPQNINPEEEEFSSKLARFGSENKDKLIYFSDDVITSKLYTANTYSAVWSRYYTIYLSVFMRIAEEGYFNLNLMKEEALPGTKDIVHYFPDHTLNLAYVHLAEPDGIKHYKPFLPYCINKLSTEPNEELIKFIASFSDKQKLDVLEAVKLFLNSDKFKNSKKSKQKADNLIQLLKHVLADTTEWEKYLTTIPQQISIALLADINFIIKKIIPHIKTKEQFKFIFDHLSTMNENDQLSILNAIAQTKYTEHSPLNIVLENNKLEIAHRLLEFGVDPNWIGTNDNYFPIHICAIQGNLEFLKLLIEKYNVNPDILDRSNNTALCHACLHQKIGEYLLERKADPNLGATPPILVAVNANNIPYIEMLLNAHANLNLPDTHGRFAIEFAVQKNQLELVKFLLENGATPRGLVEATKNNSLEAKNDSLEIIKLLLQNNVNIDELNATGSTSLHIAVYYQNLELTKLLLTNKANPNIQNSLGFSPLIFAANKFNSDLMQLLLENGANPSLIDSTGKSALSYVVEEEVAVGEAQQMDLVKLLLKYKAEPTPILIAAATKNDKELMEYLLKTIDLSQLNAKPLSVAFREGHLGIVKLLLDVNPDLINSVDSNCLTESTIASAKYAYDEEDDKQYFDWIETLLKNKVIPNGSSSGSYEKQAPIFASLNSKYLSLLVSYHADLNVINSYNETPLIIAAFEGYLDDVKLLLSHNVQLDSISLTGTALTAAAKQGHVEIVKLLLEAGANPNLGAVGRNALTAAVIGAIENTSLEDETSIFANIIQLILDSTKLDPYLPDDDGKTALTHAIEANRSDLVKIILTKVDPNIFGNRSPLMDAAYYGNVECVEVLLNHNADITRIDVLSSALNGFEKNLFEEDHFLALIKLLINRGAKVNIAYRDSTLLTRVDSLNFPELSALLKSATELETKLNDEKPDQMRYYKSLRKLQEILTTENDTVYQHANKIFAEIDNQANHLLSTYKDQAIQTQLRDVIQIAYQEFAEEKNHQETGDRIIKNLEAAAKKITASQQVSTGSMFAKAKEQESMDIAEIQHKYKSTYPRNE